MHFEHEKILEKKRHCPSPSASLNEEGGIPPIHHPLYLPYPQGTQPCPQTQILDSLASPAQVYIPNVQFQNCSRHKSPK